MSHRSWAWTFSAQALADESPGAHCNDAPGDVREIDLAWHGGRPRGRPTWRPNPARTRSRSTGGSRPTSRSNPPGWRSPARSTRCGRRIAGRCCIVPRRWAGDERRSGVHVRGLAGHPRHVQSWLRTGRGQGDDSQQENSPVRPRALPHAASLSIVRAISIFRPSHHPCRSGRHARRAPKSRVGLRPGGGRRVLVRLWRAKARYRRPSIRRHSGGGGMRSVPHHVLRHGAEHLRGESRLPRPLSDCVTKSNATPAAVGACYNASPNGDSAYDQLQSCQNAAACSTCASACAQPAVDAGAAWAGEDAGSPACELDITSTPGPTDCEHCAQPKCADAIAACIPGTSCAEFLVCIASTESANMYRACEDDYAAGFQAAQTLASCVQTHCMTECAQ